MPEQPADNERLTDHVYDGIREYDNPLPGWWTALFWGTIVFSIGYFVHYHVFAVGPSVAATYASELQALEARRGGQLALATPDESALERRMADAEKVEAGRAKYLVVCASCHAATGGGLIGPNLTDDHWLHGEGRLTDVYRVVRDGVLQKGMPPWGKQLSSDELANVVAFVGTLRGTHVAGGKAPEGRAAVRPEAARQ